jgi:N-acetyl-alpha-D-muramate 1-phosphate uridylyltransferase
MSTPARFPSHAMLLAAGLGTRLRPITDTTPKPLVEVAGKALIDRAVDAAWGEGIMAFAVNTHHLGAQVEQHVRRLERLRPGARFAFSHEPERLETGGGLRQALPLLEGDPILVMNTDAFYQAGEDRPIARMATGFAGCPTDIVLLCAHPRRATGFARSHDFCLAPDGRITNDEGAPVIYAGVALVSRTAILGLPTGTVSLNVAFEAAREAGRLYGVALNTDWFHVGDPGGLAAAEARLGVAR